MLGTDEDTGTQRGAGTALITQHLRAGTGLQVPWCLVSPRGGPQEGAGPLVSDPYHWRGKAGWGCSLPEWTLKGSISLQRCQTMEWLARQPFAKFGSEDCLLLTPPCLSMWRRSVHDSSFLLKTLQPCSSCTRKEGGFSLAISGLRDQGIRSPMVAGQRQAGAVAAPERST